ncbi:MAG: ABC transporter ATP-binding protein [Candidatus Omnitrophica bacterium]|nr:ABC transporter ATP-binding protein [Candidatus Omnitrophota bacterium]
MIVVKDLSKSFDSHLVLDHVTLSIQTGETMVIIGRSGCGKSVLLKHIIGLMQPDEGQVVVNGADLNALGDEELSRLRLKFGMLFQGAALFDSMTTFENVAFSLQEHTTMDREAIAQRVHECLQLVGLEGIDDRYPSELSGGMRKRAGLARALALNPEIMLYDEPTTGVDPIMADIINELIVTLHDKLRVTSIVVTHDMNSAYKVADRIAMLYNGNIVQVGAPEEIRASEQAVVRQFIEGKGTGPIQEGLPDRRVLSRWSTRTKIRISRG